MVMMINVRALNCVDGEYYYKARRFTGVGFRTSSGKVMDLRVFRDGTSCEEYKCQYSPYKEELAHVDINCIDFTGEYLDLYALHEGKKFSGVAYELGNKKEYCVGQHFIEKGVPIVLFTWYPSGENESLCIDRGEIYQCFEWFKDGALKNFELHSNDSDQMLISVGLTETSKLKSVWIKKNYFKWILEQRGNLEFHYFESKDSYDSLATSQVFSLVDRGIDDELFNFIFANDGFKSLSEITISRTSMSEEVIFKLSSIETLRKVAFRDRDRDLLNAVKRLKKDRPDMLVNLNGQEVEVISN